MVSVHKVELRDKADLGGFQKQVKEGSGIS